MKNLLFLLMLAISVNSFPLNYNINFTGTGASTTVESVIVQNLTQGTTVTVPVGNSLNLVSSITNSLEGESENNSNMRICQNAFEGKTVVSFYVNQSGITQLNLFGLDGRMVANNSQVLQSGTNSFELNLPQGVYVLQVNSNNFKYRGKIINSTSNANKPSITLVNSINDETSNIQRVKNEVAGITQMVYNVGDRLLYKGVSGIYSNIVTDVPTTNKTTNFKFVLCQDFDGNNYTTVNIGTQTWMAENLRTTHYQNGVKLTYEPGIRWTYPESGSLYCSVNHDATLDTKYGKIYNYKAAREETGINADLTTYRITIAPIGWHVATDTDWTTLKNFVESKFSVSLSGKALAATTEWGTSTAPESIGNNLTLNNTTGFSALPSGVRSGYDGYFRYFGTACYFWSQDRYSPFVSMPIILTSIDVGVYFMPYRPSNLEGLSVRCIMN